MKEIKKTDCLVIGHEDGETPEVIQNGTDFHLERGAKLYCSYSDHLAAVKELEKERDAYKLELDQKREDGHMIVEHGYRMAAEHEVASLTSKLQKAREAIKRAIYLDDYGGVQSDKPMDILRELIKKIGAES